MAVTPWLLYALLAPLFFTVVNFIDKLLVDRKFSPLSFTIFSSMTSIVFVPAIFFVGFVFSWQAALLGLVAGLLYFLEGFPYFKALEIEEVSRVTPLWALEAPMTLLLAFFLIGERLSGTAFAGFLLVVVGSFLISSRSALKPLRPGPAFLLMALASLMTSTMFIALKSLYAYMPYWAAQSFLFSVNGIAALSVFAFYNKGRSKLISDLRGIGFKGIAAALFRQLSLFIGIIFFGLALRLGPASLTIALGQLAAVFVFVIATFVSFRHPGMLRENTGWKTLLTKAAAIFMVVAGVFAINL